MTKEIQEKKLHEFLNWIKQPSFEVYKEYLMKKKVAYENDVKRLMRAEGNNLDKARIAQALADSMDLVITTHIDGIIKELKPPDQTDDVQIY